MAVRVNSAVLEDNDRFASVSIPVSPDGEKSGSDASDASNSSPKGKSDCCDEKFPSPRNSSPRVHSASPESSRSRASTPRAQPDAPNPFDNPSESFKLTNSFLADPYFRLNPFQPFLNAPFLATDPKAFLGDAGFGLIHSKPDIPMTIQQLQFLHNKLQGLPVCPMYQRTGRKATAASPAAGGLPSASDPPKIGRRTSEDGDESDELLSVGSESPPPPPAVTPFRRDTDNESDAGSGSLDCSFGKSKKFPAQQGNSKCENNRTLKFSIDNILKSDFGNENAVASPRKTEERKEQPKKAEAPVDLSQENGTNAAGTDAPMLWPAWVYCTRYSDRPSSGPRTRRSKNKDKNPEEKRPRTAFSGDQLSRLKHEFAENRYLTERRRQDLARELGLNEAQIKIWFQNKRAKMKKARGEKNPLALQLMAQGLYNHSTVPLTKEEEEAAAAELSD